MKCNGVVRQGECRNSGPVDPVPPPVSATAFTDAKKPAAPKSMPTKIRMPSVLAYNRIETTHNRTTSSVMIRKVAFDSVKNWVTVEGEKDGAFLDMESLRNDTFTMWNTLFSRVEGSLRPQLVAALREVRDNAADDRRRGRHTFLSLSNGREVKGFNVSSKFSNAVIIYCYQPGEDNERLDGAVVRMDYQGKPITFELWIPDALLDFVNQELDPQDERAFKN